MKTIFDVADLITKIEHPSISYSLIDLGIVTDIDIEDNTVSVVFVFPFPEIHIADDLIASVEVPIRDEL